MGNTRAAATAVGALLLSTAGACSDEAVFSSSVDDETDPAAAGISVPADASIFRSSATGPDRLNPGAKEGTPMSFVDPVLLDDAGHLPEDMSVTEAQSLQVLSKIENLLADRKLRLYEVGTVRVYLCADGDNGVDFDGWERAYRRYFANIDRDTGRSLISETGEPSQLPETSATESTGSTGSGAETTGPYAGTDNRTRPTVVTVGVAQQPVTGWLVQVEAEAVHGED